MKRSVNRWVILFAISLCFFCNGTLNCWSIFNKPLAALHGWNYSECSLAYSLVMVVIFMTGLFVGRLQNKVDPRLLLFIGLCFFGFGWFMTGRAQNLWEMYLYFSIITGIGDGCIYNTLLTSINRWFPDRKGFANGIALGLGGLTALPMAPLGNYILENFGVREAFMFFGIIVFLLDLSVFWLITKPAEGWAPPAWTAVDRKVDFSKDMNQKQMVSTWEFYALVFMYFVIGMVGSFIMSQGSSVGQDIAGITAAQAAGAISIMTVCGFVARIGLGYVGDRIGRNKVTFLIYALTVIGLLLFMAADNLVMFTIALSIIGFTFGGSMPLFPSLASDAFGSKYYGANWSIFFVGYSIASFCGPQLAAKAYATSNNYDAAFIVFAVCSAVALVLTCVYAKWGKKYHER